MCFKSILTVLAIGSLVLTASVAQADTISIVNPSFESPDYPGTVPPTGWLPTDANGGVVDPVERNHPDGYYPMPTDGLQIMFLKQPGTIAAARCRLYQKLTTDGTTPYTFASVGDTLTIDFDLARSDDSVTFRMNLWAGDDAPLVASSGVGAIYDSGVLNPSAATTWESKSFTYTATADDLGSSIWLQFDNSYGDTNPVFIDNVSASFTPIPEPGTLALLATGLIGLLCYAWRKRK